MQFFRTTNIWNPKLVRQTTNTQCNQSRLLWFDFLFTFGKIISFQKSIMTQREIESERERERERRRKKSF